MRFPLAYPAWSPTQPAASALPFSGQRRADVAQHVASLSADGRSAQRTTFLFAQLLVMLNDAQRLGLRVRM